MAFGDVAGVFVAVDRAFYPGDGGFEQRCVDDAALAGALALLEGGERADDAPHAGGFVVDGRGAEGWWVFGAAGHGHDGAVGLQERVETGGQAERAGVAECPNGTVDQPRVEFAASHVSVPGIGRVRTAGAGYAWMPENCMVTM